MRLPTIIPVCLAACGAAQAQGQISLQPDLPSAPAPRALLGTWGSAAQCARWAAGETDNPGKLPYQISRNWIRQGFLYCRVTWRGQQQSGDSIRHFADVQCGEDDLRDYRLTLSLHRQRLEIRWSPDFSTTALQPCDGAGNG